MRKHIPNTITSMNLLCGTVGVVLALGGNVPCAFVMMLCAAVADFFDGLAARVLGAYSDIGKELDSLCDMVSFGVLPSLMLCTTVAERHGWECPACWVPLLVAVFSALRLAKFNVDARQSMSFIGLPTPACAIICGALCHAAAVRPESMLANLCGGYVFIPVLALALSGLLVCELPMFSMKFHKGDRLGIDRIVFFGLVPVIVLACLLCQWPWSAAMLALFAAYIVINVATAIIK